MVSFLEVGQAENFSPLLHEGLLLPSKILEYILVHNRKLQDANNKKETNIYFYQNRKTFIILCNYVKVRKQYKLKKIHFTIVENIAFLFIFIC